MWRTGFVRPTKGLDILCKSSDVPKFLAWFRARGYRTGVEDER
ncbi:MAG TPA: hypothetical protein VF474_06055 [Phenylobacterium sp.]